MGSPMNTRYCHEMGRDLCDHELHLFFMGYHDAERGWESACSLIAIYEAGLRTEGARAYAIGYARAAYDVLG